MVETEALSIGEDLKRDLMTGINLDLGVKQASETCAATTVRNGLMKEQLTK